MPAWPTCARILLFVVFSLFGQSGHFGPHPHHKYKHLKSLSLVRTASGRIRRSLDDEPRLQIHWEPGKAIANKPFSQQPLLMLTDQKGNLLTNPLSDGDDREWVVQATKANPSDPDLKGLTTAPLRKGRATFEDLRIAGTSNRYVINFHIMSAMLNVNTSSIKFMVTSPYVLKVTKTHVKNEGNVNPLLLDITFRIDEDNQIVQLQNETEWLYTVSLREPKIYNGNIKGSVNGTFSQIPFTIRNLEFWGHAYNIQLTVSVFQPSVNWTIQAYSDAFNAIPRSKGRDRTFSKKVPAHVHYNGSFNDAMANQDIFFASFLNKFALRNLKVEWKDVGIMGEPQQIHWNYFGRTANVIAVASTMYTTIRKGCLIQANGFEWTIHVPMVFNHTDFYGREGPPPEEELYIGGYRFVHIVLFIVLLGLVIPVIVLVSTWRKRERSIQQRYQQRLMMEEPPEEPKNKKNRINGHLNTGFDGINNVSGESSMELSNNRPIFTIQDHMPNSGMNSVFSPTEALPPTRFRWSAPEKSGVVELTMAQLREQNHNFMEQGTGLSFSRYKDIIHQKNSETVGPKQGKPFSAPVVPTLSKWSLPTRGNSRLVMTSALEPPSKTATGVIEVLHPSALPAPNQEVPSTCNAAPKPI